MKHALRVFAFLSAALLASCSLTLFDYSNITTKKYALVYGVAMYVSGAGTSAGVYPNLNYPGSDASGVAAMLKQEGYSVTSRWVNANGDKYFNGANIGNLSSNDTETPYISNMIADINNLQSSVGPNDIIVFYFSGHGMQDTSSSPPHEYIVPSRGVISDGSGSWVGDASLSVRDDQLGSMLSALTTKRKVVILDTCNSGGFIGNSLEADSIPQVAGGSTGGVTAQVLAQAISNYASFQPSADGISPYGGAMVLSAAGRDESCYESDSPYFHGVMTYYLLNAQQSGDLNHDGHVTVAEAFSLAKAGIDKDWNANSYVQQNGLTFEPRVSGGPIDFVLW